MLPNQFKEAYYNFSNWHFSLEERANKTNGDEGSLIHLFNSTYPEFVKQIEKMGLVCSGYDDDTAKACKSYIKESDIYNLFLQSAWYKQIITKPRGYAGDSTMMEIMYNDQFEGITPFGKLYTKLANAVEGSQAVRNRRSYLRKKLQKLDSGKVLSVAAGPALEIKDCEHKNGLEFLALDHDMETLRRYAPRHNSNFTYGICNAFHLMKGQYGYIIPRKSFAKRANPKADMKGFRKLLMPFRYHMNTLPQEGFELIYAAGLYDYIYTSDNPSKGSMALTKNLFSLLKPGGQLIVGNYAPTIPRGTRWVLEYICDWNLIYREDSDLKLFAKGISEKQIADIKIKSEETGITKFLHITKTQ